ncbi:MAG: OmpA family protein [Bacteroidia bacterium]|nr:OmpA family protein [Bacteroidia bacterium]
MRTFNIALLLGFILSIPSLYAQETSMLKFFVREKEQFDPKSGVICLVKKDTVVLKEYRSDAYGEIKFSLPNDAEYRITFQLPGYESTKFDLDMRKFKGITVDLDVEMIPKDWVLYKGSFHDRSADKFMALTPVKIKNLYTGEEVIEYTNEAGLVFYYMKPRQKYEITPQAPAHLNRRAVINTDCGTGAEVKYCIQGFNFENFMDPDYEPKTIIGTLMLDSIKINQTFSFDILYDLGSANLRPEGTKILDMLTNLMNDNPGIIIELSAHTDSRGDAASNLKLSEQRAESCVAYLRMKGIDDIRIDPKGYGETRIQNECTDGVPCSEEKHQENRRTEVRIIQIMDPQVIKFRKRPGKE